MGINRGSFQGVTNIVRFNWHYYLLAGIVFVSIVLFKEVLPYKIALFLLGLSISALIAIVISLIASFCIYDVSDLYKLNWLANLDEKKVLNIHAGLDETSEIIKYKFPQSEVVIADFYNPEKHTEISIKRARKTYPPLKNTIKVTTGSLPFDDEIFDTIICFLSAHEIRIEKERIQFFKELNRITKPTGCIYVTEHLRDRNNFIAYTLGFFHFHSKATWMFTFEQSKFKVTQSIKNNPFIATFILEKDGNTL